MNIYAVVSLVFGIALLIYASTKAIDHSIKLASAFGVPPLLIGLVLLSIGTDLPEIANSIISSAAGHGDINIGDSLGSILGQMTLVFGLIPFLGRDLNVHRREILIVGAIEVLALVLVLSVTLIGFTILNSFLLIASWPIFILLIKKTTTTTTKKQMQHPPQTSNKHLFHMLVAVLGFIGVAVGAMVVIQSVIILSAELQIPEFFISFFVLGIGTSLPEIVVDLKAFRRGEYELVVGDIIGSCIVDALISILRTNQSPSSTNSKSGSLS